MFGLYKVVSIKNDSCQYSHSNYCREWKRRLRRHRISVDSIIREACRKENRNKINFYFHLVKITTNRAKADHTYLFPFHCLSCGCFLISTFASSTSSSPSSSSSSTPRSSSSLLSFCSLLLALFFPSALIAVRTQEAMSRASFRLLLAMFFLKV